MQATDLDDIDDVEILRQLAKSQLHQIASHERELHYRQTKIDALIFEMARLKRWQYGASSESFTAEQRSLFAESLDEDIEALETALAAEQTALPNHQPTAAFVRPKRQPLPAHLPRIEHRHEPDACVCTNCQAPLRLIGEDTSEQLDCEPVRFFVHRHIRPKYACDHCETLTAAPLPAQIIDKGLPASGLLAQVLIAKYQDHLPLYRQEAIYTRSGVALSRSTLAGWVAGCGIALQPLVDALREHLLQQSVLHADETPVAVLTPGKGQTHRAYLWAYRNSASSPRKAVVFDFQMSRAGRHAEAFLADFNGALMVDDYGGYKALFASHHRIELACLAHIRRKFFELHQASKSLIANQALGYIAQLYAIEAEAADSDHLQRQALRQLNAKPVLNAFYDWLTITRTKVPKSSGTAKAIDYALKRWAALLRYLDHGEYPIDNNAIENAIRPIALGRKNWLFAGTETAGRRAAAIMSLIESAKLNGHDPFAYLKDILARLPTQPNSRIAELLPYHWQPTN